MAKLLDIREILTKYYKRQKRQNARLFKKMWVEISLTLQGKNKSEIELALLELKGAIARKGKSKEKTQQKTSTNTNTSNAKSDPLNLKELLKESIKEIEDESKPVSGAGEIFCKKCRQNVYPEEYNKALGMCYMCEKENNGEYR